MVLLFAAFATSTAMLLMTTLWIAGALVAFVLGTVTFGLMVAAAGSGLIYAFNHDPSALAAIVKMVVWASITFFGLVLLMLANSALFARRRDANFAG